MTATMLKGHKRSVAFDRGSARTVDENGFLHVEGCNISKACVNPYWGAEIPDYEALGLQPDKVYQLLRDPDELEKAAPTFNNLPLMDDHVAVGADELEDGDTRGRVAGSTGTGARFEKPYLINEIVVWTAKGIDGVMSKRQTELSCAYRYKLDMTPGTYEGQPYDGRMYDIVGNHVALVDEGRAGHDVVVKDRKPDRLRVQIDLKGVARLVADALRPVKRRLGMDADADTLDGLVDDLASVKARIDELLKPGANDADGKVLDDCTSAIDLAVHHLMDYREDRDVSGARDDNPMGINQYTGAAGRADRVGKAAGSKGGPSHKDAQAAHQRAAVAANRAGRSSETSAHLRVAAAHGALHSDPQNAAAKATLAGHYGRGGDSLASVTEDYNPEGINQYTGKGGTSKSDVAKQATQQAKLKSAFVEHAGHPKYAAAANAHEKAGRLHREAAKEAPNATAKREHEAQAREHEKRGAFYRSRSASGMKAHDSVTMDVTVDDNPEGINQYTKGGGGSAQKTGYGHTALKAHDQTKSAKEASAKAKASGSKEDHIAARNAHERAAELHQKASEKAPDAKAELAHMNRAQSHLAAAERHGKASGGSRTFGSLRAHDSVAVDIAEREDVSPEAGRQKYGDVRFADPKNKRYPIDTPDHVRSAATYWGRQRNRNFYSKEDQDAITKRIEAAKKKFKIGEYAESK